MRSRPLVSTIIPVYNGERYLAEAIESVLAQTYRPMKLIVVDDGSVDSTTEIVKAYPDVQYVYQTNQGHAAAKNAGIKAAQGDILAFLDADDLWEPEKLSIQVNHLVEHPDVGYVLCWADTFLEPGIDRPLWLGRDELEEESPLLGPSSLVVRKAVIEEIGGFDTAYRHANDCDWFFRARDAGVKMAIVPLALVHRRIHASNMSHERHAAASEIPRALKASIVRKRRAQGTD